MPPATTPTATHKGWWFIPPPIYIPSGSSGGGGPLALEPVFQMPSGTHFSVFASALVTGSPEFLLSEIPFQAIVDRVADGTYKAKPAKVFRLEDIPEAHRLMESGGANGKIVVRI